MYKLYPILTRSVVRPASRRFALGWVKVGILSLWLLPAIGMGSTEQKATLPLIAQERLAASEQLLADQRYTDAARLVESLIDELSQTPSDGVPPYLHEFAGNIYLQAGAPEVALRHFDWAIEGYGTESFSPALVQPLQGLAVTYLRLGLVAEAEQALLRAQHITHREQGVYSVEQLAILEELTTLKERDVLEEDQDHLYRYHLRIHEDAFGRDDPRTASSMLRLAHHLGEKAVQLRYRPNGYKRRVYRQESHELFERAISALKAAHGPHSLDLLEPLRDYAGMLFRHRGRYDQSFAGKRRSIELIREAEQIIAAQPDATGADLAAARVAVADVYVIWGKGGALPLYREAWDMIADDPQFDIARQELFGEPVRLTDQTLSEKPEYVRSPPLMANGEALYSEIAFKVAANGRVRKTETVGGNVPHWRTFDLKDRLESVRYRPRFVDGEPVDTEGLVHVQPYRAGLASWYRGR